MPKAKRSRRENLSDSDREKLRLIKQHEKEWKIKLKELWAWDDKYKQSSPEDKKRMLKLRDLTGKHGLISSNNLSEKDLLILELKYEAFKETDSRTQTKEEQVLTEYARK